MKMTKMSKVDIGFTEEELQQMLENIDSFTPEEALEIDKLVDELSDRKNKQAARDDLIAFCLYIDSTYKVGRHHRILADHWPSMCHILCCPLTCRLHKVSTCFVVDMLRLADVEDPVCS